MNWVDWAFLCMFLTVIKTLLAKDLLRSFTSLQFIFLDIACSLLFLLPVLLIQGVDFRFLTSEYLLALFVVMVPGLFAAYCLSKATQTGHISEVAPLLLLIPVLSALVAPFITGERVSTMGWFGISVVVGGGYLLKLEDWRQPLGPFVALYREPSSRWVCVTILISIVNVNVEKLLILKSSPLESMLIQWSMSLPFVLGLLRFARQWDSLTFGVKEKWPWLLVLGLVTMSSMASQYYAYSNGGHVAYVLCIKRVSVIFITGIAIYSMKEPFRFGKAFGVSVMLVGAFILYDDN